jgi:hypothetical protein
MVLWGMALFHRRARGGAEPPARDRAAVGAERFWAWWAGARDQVTVAAAGDQQSRLSGLLAPRVRTIDPRLSWQVGAGSGARFMLVLSGGRSHALRPVTERWRLAGPPADDVWEFHPAVPADPGAFQDLVELGDRTIDPGQASALIRADDARCRIDISVFHPVFAGLDDTGRRRVGDVLVGWALGEDDTDRWVGQVEAVRYRPLDSVPVAMLPALTDQLADRWSGERWVSLEGSFGDRRLIASLRHPLHRVDHPLLDQHLAVRLPYLDTMPDGLPTERSLGDLLSFERTLTDRLGDRALLVAQQTTSGERLLHFYADSTASPLPMIQAMLGGYLGPPVTVTAQDDPGWESIEHLRP